MSIKCLTFAAIPSQMTITEREGGQTVKSQLASVFEPVSLYPLVAFRLAFGAAMAMWSIYMLVSGAVNAFFIEPDFFFSYSSFAWIKPLPALGMYLAFVLLLFSSLLIFAGYYFRIASIAFTLVFAYVTLIDKSAYLSYYYYVLLLAFMLSISPANRLFSIDLLRKPSLRVDYVPNWSILAFKIQVALVFVFAGMAKLNSDWLFEGRPVNIWLNQLSENGFLAIPEYLTSGFFPIILSWVLIMFDFMIPHFLLDKKTAKGAVLTVVLMQIIAIFLFPSGFFPVLTAFSCLIFLPESLVNRFLSRIAYFLYDVFEFKGEVFNHGGTFLLQYRKKRLFPFLLAMFFSAQILLPVSLFLNWGSNRWADSAFRFSWDIRLHNKTGEVDFFLTDNDSGKSNKIALEKYLTPHQIKIMAEDPSLIKQFADFLISNEDLTAAGRNYTMNANAVISLNGGKPQPLINYTRNSEKQDQ
jgi:hypothetical protein